MKLWLNDNWERKSTPDVVVTQPPAAGAWTASALPDTLGRDSKDNIGWWRRKFTPDERLKGGRCLLQFQRADYEATVWLNGKKLISRLGPWSGFEVDVTDALVIGQPNELLVAVRNGFAVLGEADLKKNPPALTENSEVLGPGAGRAVQLWEIAIVKEPRTRIADIFATPSFRRMELTVATAADGLADGEYTLSQEVLFEGKKLAAFPEQTLSAAQGKLAGTATLKMANPPLWDLGQPNLLQLQATLRDQAGNILDQSSVRFGFREMWTEGNRLMLNGNPVKLRGFAMASSWNMRDRMQRDDIRARFIRALANGGQFQRHAYDPIVYDVCDEVGLPLAAGLAGISHPTIQKIESDRYWQTAEADATQNVLRHRNRPSICEWYISNEFVETSPEGVTPLAVKRVGHLADAVDAADGSRIIEAGCDLDLRGRLEIICTHYPVDLGALRTSSAYMPVSRLWRFPAQTFQVGDKVPMGQFKNVANVRGSSPFEWGRKPIIINENGWIYFFAPPKGLVEVGGEAVYSGPVGTLNAFFEAHRLFAEGHRDAEATVITPWNHLDQWNLAKGVPACDIVPILTHSGWRAGTRIAYDINVHHDLLAQEDCELSWGVRVGAGERNVCGRQALDLRPYDLKRMKAEFTIPDAETPTPIELFFDLTRQDGTVLVHRTMPGTVFPAKPLAAPASAKFALFDPAGGTAAALAKAGLALPATDASPESLKAATVVVVGENCPLADLEPRADALKAFLASGGNLLVLRQNDDLCDRLVGESLAPAKGVEKSRCFLRMAGHPLAAVLREEVISTWAPDGRVTTMPFTKPSTGSFRSIVDTSDGNAGLEYTVLAERQVGPGRILATQFDLVSRLDEAPNAGFVLQALVDDIAVKRPGGQRKAAVFADPAGLFLRKLTYLGVVADINPPTDKMTGYDLLLIDASRPAAASLLGNAAGIVSNGGTVYIHGATGEAFAQALAALTGTRVTGHPPDAPAWRARVLKTNPSPLLDGLSGQDLFWKKACEGEDMNDYFWNERFDLDAISDWTWTVPGSEPQAYPAAVIVIPAGTGKVVLDNLRWDVAAKALSRKTDRIASQIMLNLGVEIDGTGKSKKLLADLEYVPVDLRPVLNRPLIDEVDDDGEGGWTDQGAGADLRSFGEQVDHAFHGIPFVIPEGNRCLVMASKFRKTKNPMTAEIKVGRKAKALYFLQTSAWTSAIQHGSYLVTYEDSSFEEISLEGGGNLRDWSGNGAQEPFMNETDTFTQWAWTGAGGTPQFAKVSVFMMQWINPYPDKVIADVTVQSSNNAILVLMGLTLGIGKDGAGADAKGPAATEDPVACRKYYEEAATFIKDGNVAAAEPLLRLALAAAPSDIPTRIRLANALLAMDKNADAEGLMKETIRLYPQTLEAYLMLGRFYEDADRIEEAQEVYLKSIEVEPNQPPIIQALERVGQKK
jgi:hypothetical protein